LERFKEAINYWLELIDELGEYPNRGNIHKYGYRKVREKFPKLYSETVQEAMNQGIQIYRANGMSEYTADTMSFKARAINIDGHNIQLPMLQEEKVWLPMIVPSKFKKLFEEEYGHVVLKKRENWYVYISFYIAEKEPYKPNGWFGVDLGIRNIATISDKNGDTKKFFNGEQLRERRDELLNKRSELQSRKSRENSVWRALKDISEKEKNYTDDLNHKVSREIVEMAKYSCYGLVVESVKGIRNLGGKEIHRWKFHDLLNKIKYKAKLEGVPLKIVSSRNGATKTCSECGEKNEIGAEETYKCSNCDLEIHRDLNATKNLASIPLRPSERSLLEMER